MCTVCVFLINAHTWGINSVSILHGLRHDLHLRHPLPSPLAPRQNLPRPYRLRAPQRLSHGDVLDVFRPRYR